MTVPPRSKLFFPGAAIGVLGAGHWTRLFTLAARRMGCRVHSLAPLADVAEGQAADVEITAEYHDADAIRSLASKVVAVTLLDESVPALALAAAAARALVVPSHEAASTVRNPLRFRRFLQQFGLPCAVYRVVKSLEELCRALLDLGAPATLTPVTNEPALPPIRVGSLDQAAYCWNAAGRPEGIVEPIVDYDRELWLTAARTADGGFAAYPLAECERWPRSSEIDLVSMPARVDDRVHRDAEEIARAALESLSVWGVATVGFLLTPDQHLIVHRLAPHPTELGAPTLDACQTPHLEQHLRAICGLGLGSARLLLPAATAFVSSPAELDFRAAAAFAEMRWCWYGRLRAGGGAALGHLTAIGRDVEEARRLAVAARGALEPS